MRKWLSVLMVFGLIAVWLVPSASAASTVRMTVVFKADTLPADAAQIVQKAGGTVLSSHAEIGVMEISGPATLLKTLGNHQAITSVGPTLEYKLGPANMVESSEAEAVNTAAADLYNLYQWDIKQVTNGGASWNLSTGSHNTVVGIIDTGVSQNHPALKANVLGGRNFTPDGPGGTVVPTDIEDRHGHGSHVAGNIAGNGRILGIGPDLGIRAYRVFGASGGAPSSRIVAAMIAAVNDGVDVISMSLGGYDTQAGYSWTDPDTGDVYRFKDVASTVAQRRAIRYAVQHGVVVVAAAGNDATNISNPTANTALLNALYGPEGYSFWGATFETPGNLAGVVTVSATGPDKSLASYSNYGAGAIDVAAPGGDFQRYPQPNYHFDMNLSAYKGTGYVWMAGTSMATPKVSAVAALIIDQAKAGGQHLSPAQVTARLQQTAVDIGQKGTDPYFGKGMVNAYTALGGN